MRTPKAVPVVLRRRPGGTEVLVFEHPLAGIQLVKGTVEQGESVNDAAARELTEESGIQGATCARDLGTWEQCPSGQVWHFREMNVPGQLPDSWNHLTADDGGHVFAFKWHLVQEAPPPGCHPAFIAAFVFLRRSLALAGEASTMGHRAGVV